MGRTILGPAERVSGFSRADLSGFVAEHYGPGQMIVAAAGAVDHDALVRQAEDLFGHLSPLVRTGREPARWQGTEPLPAMARTAMQAGQPLGMAARGGFVSAC